MGCSAFARRYWRNHSCFLFLQVLRWFTSLRCLLTAYEFSGGSFGISQRGFPHSEIPGSKLICSSPGLIAAYRVLHRLLVPRHSPYTLSSLTIRNSSSRLAYATRQLHAHCMFRLRSCERRRTQFVVGKNYRLQNIQLSKNSEIADFRIQISDCQTNQHLQSEICNLPDHWWRIPGSNR